MSLWVMAGLSAVPSIMIGLIARHYRSEAQNTMEAWKVDRVGRFDREMDQDRRDKAKAVVDKAELDLDRARVGLLRLHLAVNRGNEVRNGEEHSPRCGQGCRSAAECSGCAAIIGECLNVAQNPATATWCDACEGARLMRKGSINGA